MLLQIGTLSTINQPACLPYDWDKPVLCWHSPPQLERAVRLCELITLQLLHTTPAKAVLYEAIPSPYFAELKRLFALSAGKYGEQLFNIRALKAAVTYWVEQVHRRYALLAQAGSANFMQYRQQTGQAHAFETVYLVLNGLNIDPLDIQEELQTLCLRGVQVGIVPVLLHDETSIKTISSENRRQVVQDFWHALKSEAFGMVFQQTDFTPLGIKAVEWQLLQRFGVQLESGERCAILANDLIAQLKHAENTNPHSDFLHIEIGLHGVTPVHFNMGEFSDVYHALIGGTTRSGKTNLLNNLILSACEHYTPEQLQFTLLDFKDGVSFWEYEGLAHIASLYAPLEPNFDWAIVCIEQFTAEINQRIQLFRHFRGVQTLADYNRCAEKKLPRHILLIDEVQKLFTETSFQQKNRIKALLSEVAKECAAMGLHIILSTQSYQNLDLDSDFKEQCHLRIGFKQATSMACRALMGRDNEGMLNLPRFHAIYNAHFGEETFNRTVALHHLKDFSQRLDALKAAYPRVNHVTPPPSVPTANDQPASSPPANQSSMPEWLK